MHPRRGYGDGKRATAECLTTKDRAQNTAAKTTISPHSRRGTLTPYVAALSTWEEIEGGGEGRDALGQLTHEEVLRRADKHGDLHW